MSGDVPEGWQTASLGDVLRLEYGRALSEAVREDGDVQVYGSNGVVGHHSTPLVSRRGIVVGRKGTAGSVTVTEGPFWAIDTAYYVEPCQEVDFDWLAAILQYAHLSELNESTGVPGLNRDKVYREAVLIPPLDEQWRIAEVLRASNAHVTSISALLSSARATKNAALIDALSAGWPETTVADLLAVTRYPMRSGPFGSALLKSELQTEGIPLLGIDNVQVERFVPTYRRFVSKEKYQELARYTVFPSDVMITIMGTVGRCCIVPPSVGLAISSKHVWTITLDPDRYSPPLLAWQVNHAPWVLDQLRGESQGGIMSAISSATLRDLVIPLPPWPELRQIEQLLLSFNELISTTEAELERAQATNSAIADDLLSGRVRVPIAPEAGASPRTVQPAFKRAVFAAEIVHQLHADNRFGSVKHEKIVHLCELHLGLQQDLDRHAYKEAAGPYDPKARRSVEGIFRQQKWFDVTKVDGARVVYQPLANSGGHADYFERYFGARRADIQALIDLLRPMTTQQCEIVATLYSAWNDFLIEGEAATDSEVVQSVLNNWHPSKQQITEERWLSALPWMRRHGLIPKGQGEKTRVST